LCVLRPKIQNDNLFCHGAVEKRKLWSPPAGLAREKWRKNVEAVHPFGGDVALCRLSPRLKNPRAVGRKRLLLEFLNTFSARVHRAEGRLAEFRIRFLNRGWRGFHR